jgi:hypothetical protein
LQNQNHLKHFLENKNDALQSGKRESFGDVFFSNSGYDFYSGQLGQGGHITIKPGASPINNFWSKFTHSLCKLYRLIPTWKKFNN